jgi:hypothetical protein
MEVVLLADYSQGSVLLSMLWFFLFILWFWLLFTVFADLFRRHDVSGWGKTGWIIFVILLPFLGVFIYLIAEGKGMAERNVKQMQSSQAEMDNYIRSVSSSGGATGEIAQAKQLLDSGAITQAEYDQIKSKALAT